MPKGPNGERRPADVIGCAVSIARIATGEDEDTAYVSKNRRKSGVAGGKARSANLNKEDRREIAVKAAQTRWTEKRRETMTGSCQAALENRLFATEGRILKNFKMLRGDAPSVSKEELCDEIHSGITQRLTGLAETHSDFPEDAGAESIDLQSLK